MTAYYKATFSDGTTVRRSTASRKYSHAWLVKRPISITEDTRKVRSWHGFSKSAQHAQQGMRAYAGMRATFAETAPAIEITRKEYLELA